MLNACRLTHSLLSARSSIPTGVGPPLTQANTFAGEEEEEEALIGAFDGSLGLIGKHGEQLAPRWKLRQG